MYPRDGAFEIVKPHILIREVMIRNLGSGTSNFNFFQRPLAIQEGTVKIEV